MPVNLHDTSVHDLLEENYLKYNHKGFIDSDPICIPHRYSKLQDIEISGFFAASLAWGQRKTIIKKCGELMQLMDDAPYDFVMHHQDSDLKTLLDFKHRTFNSTDLLYFIHFFRKYYRRCDSLEEIFLARGANVRKGIEQFYEIFIEDAHFPGRTAKHVANPAKKSACKRINMFLRWMVREDLNGVDFGIWKRIQTDQLVCPCDVHVEKVARRLGLLVRKQLDWQAAEELTNNLKKFDARDPVRFDYALFGLGLNGEFY